MLLQRLLEKLRLSNNPIKPVILRYDNTKVNKYCISIKYNNENPEYEFGGYND